MAVGTLLLLYLANGPAGKMGAIATGVCLTYAFAWPGLDDVRRVQLSRLAMVAGAITLALGTR